MEQPVNGKIILYSSLFITATISLPRLLLVQRDGALAQLLPFNTYEWLTQVLVSFVFCICMFYRNSYYMDCYTSRWQIAKHGRLLAINLSLLLFFTILGGVLTRVFFHVSFLPANGYFLRLLVCSILIVTELKVLATIYAARQKERENEQLRTTNAVMELELLKAQLNPHFFFNALSSLAGVVREDPSRAQQYIAHLSKIFRYPLQKNSNNLTTLEEELDAVYAYGELMKMRHESGFRLVVDVPAALYEKQLPHMTLQPLLENALKHNIVAAETPLTVSVVVADDSIEVRNNLQEKAFPEPGTGTGLANLNERFRILTGKEITVTVTAVTFTVKIPLQS